MNESCWIKNADKLAFPKLDCDLETDIVIVGAGITGVTLGYYLMNTDKDFVILEANEVGYGASGRSTGKITSQHSLVYNYLSRHYSNEVAKEYYVSNEEAIDSIENIIQEHHIDCDFKRIDSIVYTESNNNVHDINEEFETCRGLKINCELVENADDPIPFIKGIRFFNQAQYNPLLYLQGLAEVIDLEGYEIFENSPVKEISKSDEIFNVFCGDYVIHAKQVVLATQFPFIDEGQLYFSKLFHEESNLYCAKIDKDFKSQWISNDEEVKSYRSFQEKDTTYLLMGGVHHPVGRENDLHDFLEECKQRFSLQGEVERWSSQDYTTADRLPLIGPLVESERNLLFASGYQKWGNTLGCIAAKLLCAQLLQQKSQYAYLFDPHREGLLMNTTSIKENFNTVKALIKSKFQHAQYVMPQPGSGAIVNIDGDKYGVYMDEQGVAHILDITCTHMGCTCVYNDKDKTWDCPCHGSRFSIEGEIIKGPATNPLKKIDGDNKVNPHIVMRKERNE